MTADNIPQLSSAQRQDGMKKSLEVRRARAQAKVQLTKGVVTLEEFMELDDAQGVKVKDMLCALPNIGNTRADRIMQRIGIADCTRVQGLGCRQKQALLDMLQT